MKMWKKSPVHVCKKQNKTKNAHDVRKIFNYEKRMIRQGDKLFRALQVEKGFFILFKWIFKFIFNILKLIFNILKQN